MRKVYKTIALSIYYSLYHDKTFTQIPHSQWFIDIGYKKCMSIWPLRTMDQQLERMTLGTQDLATRNKQSIIFRYDLIRCIAEKDDIYENSEFTCFCKILRSRKILQVRLLIIIKWENIHFWYLILSWKKCIKLLLIPEFSC